METTFESIFKARNPQYAFLLSRMREAIGVESVEFEHINSVNLRKFKDYMDGEVSANSLKVYNAVIAATIREMYNDGFIQNVRCVDVLKVKNEPQQNICLTPDEIERMWTFYTKLPHDSKHKLTREVLALFLIECFTGARGSDVIMFSEDNIHDRMLTYVSKKTKTLTSVVAHQRLPILFADIPKKDILRSTKNYIIKSVAKKCGITEIVSLFYHGQQRKQEKYKFLGFHSARRSFVTNLIDLNVPLSVVSKMAGHKNVSMTQKYYVNQNYNIPQEAMSFFNG